MGQGRSRTRAWLAGALVAALAASALIAGSASGERVQRGNLVVSLNGGISPLKLPRDHVAPVAVIMAGEVHTSDRTPIPRVNWIKLALGWRGRLDTQGLTVCPQARLATIDSASAIATCGSALVGHGRLYAKVFVPGQAPFGIHARLLAFNGKTKVGRPAVLVHAYSANPPISFVLPFAVRHQPGSFRTILVTTIRRSVGPWPHVASFQITVSRSFSYRGKSHSYTSASCPIPRSFTAGFLSFARATFAFSDGRNINVDTVRTCRAR
jgi:hypothetical protein